MSIPLILLAIFSIFFGYITKDLFIGIGTAFFNDNSLFIHPDHEILINTEFGVPTIFKLLPFILTILFFIIALLKYEFKINLWKLTGLSRTICFSIYSFINQRFLVEFLYNKYITSLVFKLGGETTKIVDKGATELIGPFGLEKVLLNLGTRLSKLDTAALTTYALYIVIGLVFYLTASYVFIFDNSLVLLLFIVLFSINYDKLYQKSI